MKYGSYLFWLILSILLLIRISFRIFDRPPDISPCLREEVYISGNIVDEPVRKDSGQSFTLMTDRIALLQEQPSDNRSNEKGDCTSHLYIRVKTSIYPELFYGDKVAFSGKLNRPANFVSEIGRSFDYEGYLSKDGIYYEVKSAKDLVVSEVDSAPRSLVSVAQFELNKILFFLKRNFVRTLERYIHEPASSLGAGLVVGEKSSLGNEYIDKFRAVGLIHIIVLSGFNITIIAVAMRKVLDRLPRVWGIVVGASGIVLFGIMVGGGATVVRSCLMAILALTSEIMRRDYNIVRSIIFVMLVMLIENPTIFLHDPSFQLSFLATTGLIILANPLEEKLSFIPEKFGLRSVVATSLATQIFVTPYLLWMMGETSIIGLFTNIIVLPIVPWTMLLVFVTGTLGQIHSFFGTSFGLLSQIILDFILYVADTFSRFPIATVTVLSFHFGWVIIFYTIFAILYSFMIRRPE